MTARPWPRIAGALLLAVLAALAWAHWWPTPEPGPRPPTPEEVALVQSRDSLAALLARTRSEREAEQAQVAMRIELAEGAARQAQAVRAARPSIDISEALVRCAPGDTALTGLAVYVASLESAVDTLSSATLALGAEVRDYQGRERAWADSTAYLAARLGEAVGPALAAARADGYAEGVRRGRGQAVKVAVAGTLAVVLALVIH